MPRAMICAVVDETDEVVAVDAWLARWRSRLRFVSANEGCGCCVNIYRIEASQEALDELPATVFVESEWSSISSDTQLRLDRSSHAHFEVP